MFEDWFVKIFWDHGEEYDIKFSYLIGRYVEREFASNLAKVFPFPSNRVDVYYLEFNKNERFSYIY